MLIVSKTPAGTLPVYDIGVPETHNFILENGLVSHNCFNKSHSIAYSMITYICAWLKANYPHEFFCSLMTTRSRSLQPKDWAMRAPQFINEAKQLGINIHPPTINASAVGFTVRNENVYFGLNAIKDIGLGTARSIINSRGKTQYKDIYDFLARINMSKVNTKHFQALVMAGTFDRMGYLRKDLLDITQDLYNWVRALQEYHERVIIDRKRTAENIKLNELIEKRNFLRRFKRLKRERDLTEEEETFLTETKGIRLFKLFDTALPARPHILRHKQISLSVVELMQQADFIGCYIGTHPASIIYPNSTRIANARLGEKQSLSGVVSTMKVITDRNGREMAFMGYGDGTGIAEAVIFASTYSKLKAVGGLPEIGELIETYGVVDEIDPQVKVKLFSVNKYRSNT